MGKLTWSEKIPTPIPDGGGLGIFQWSGGVALNGKLYCVPYTSNYILIYDPKENKLTWSEKIPTPIPDGGDGLRYNLN